MSNADAQDTNPPVKHGDQGRQLQHPRVARAEIAVGVGELLTYKIHSRIRRAYALSRHCQPRRGTHTTSPREDETFNRGGRSTVMVGGETLSAEEGSVLYVPGHSARHKNVGKGVAGC